MPEPILEGDLVEHRMSGDDGEVISVNATHATVQFNHGIEVVSIDDLTFIG